MASSSVIGVQPKAARTAFRRLGENHGQVAARSAFRTPGPALAFPHFRASSARGTVGN